MKEFSTVQIEMTEKMVYSLNEAIEVYYRISMGQLDQILQMKQFDGLSYEDKEKAMDKIMELKEILFSDLNNNRGSSYGIAHKKVSDSAKEMCDLHQVVRHDISWFKKPEGNKWNVWFDEPLRVSKERLPTTKIKEI